jgi:hypothetical protein
MAQTGLPAPVKMIIAVLWSDEASREQVFAECKTLWGSMDFQGADHVFDVTDYYEPEMGSPLYRRLISFKDLVQPDRLAELKLRTNEIEMRHRASAGRLINLDIGYLDHNKLVLASAKAAGQKIYVGQGMYADLIARFGHGNYQPFEWTFIDFKDGRYNKELNEIRDIYLSQLRKAKV